MYFISTRPLDPTKTQGKDWDIWYVEKTRNEWSPPKNLGAPVNSAKDEWYVSFTQDNTLYFASNRKGGLGSHDIYRSRFVNRSYAEPQNLGNHVNSQYLEQDPFIAVDESFLLFTSVGRPGGHGSGDIYISYRDAQRAWSKARNLGKVVNTSGFEFCPILSPDQKYFFYTSKGDIYWIDSNFLKRD